MKQRNDECNRMNEEGVAMKQVESAVRIQEEPTALHPQLINDKGRAQRQVPPMHVSQSLVTLAPAGAELDEKQRTMAEQFRVLRARVKSLSNDFQLRTILITSALPGEGKTTVSANLAGTLSRIEGMRVLLMDLDLRQPNLHTVFGVEPDPRASSPLAGETPWQSSVYQVNRRLDVLFGFRPLEEPDRLLQSNRLKNLLDEARADYDVVIIDSAPLLAVADTQSVVPFVDCGLFVLNADATPIAAAREALSMLRDKVVGCVVNRVKDLKSENYYRKSGYGYGYGSNHTEN